MAAVHVVYEDPRGKEVRKTYRHFGVKLFEVDGEEAMIEVFVLKEATPKQIKRELRKAFTKVMEKVIE